MLWSTGTCWSGDNYKLPPSIRCVRPHWPLWQLCCSRDSASFSSKCLKLLRSKEGQTGTEDRLHWDSEDTVSRLVRISTENDHKAQRMTFRQVGNNTSPNASQIYQQTWRSKCENLFIYLFFGHFVLNSKLRTVSLIKFVLICVNWS